MSVREMAFQSIFERGRYCNLLQLSDGRIITNDGCSFDVHKVILASCSDYFRAMFCGFDKNKKEHKISNINGECLNEILCYIYTNNICVTEMNVKDLLVAADYFLMKDLYFLLKESVKNYITDANCLKLCHVAYERNENDMFQCCFAFVQTRFKEIIKNQKNDLVSWPLELLKCVLRNRNLNVENERTVWEVIIYWTQADMESRLNDVPSLLSTLAVDEIEKKLATEIINHPIVFNNTPMNSLKISEFFSEFDTNLDLLTSFIQKNSNEFQLQKFRIPRKLNIISKYIKENGEQGTCGIFISYDETLNFWYQIKDVNFRPKYLSAIGSNVYIFQKMGGRCKRFNLREMEIETMGSRCATFNLREIETMTNFGCDTLVVIKNCICMINPNHNEAYDIKVYNVFENRWISFKALDNFCLYSVVVIGENLIAVGDALNSHGMVMKMLNPVTQQEISLPSPKVFRTYFDSIVHRRKIYLIGGLDDLGQYVSDVEVYDLETNKWNKTQPLPKTYLWSTSIVLNDQIFVYEFVSPFDIHYPSLSVVRWNETKECWDRLEKPNLPVNLWQYSFCTIDDIETVKHLTKLIRNSEIKVEKSPFQECVKEINY